MGLMATFYTTLGGLRAVLWTDVIQFLILCAGAVWIAISLGNNVSGSYAEIFSTASQAGKFDVFSLKLDWFKMTAASAGFAFFFIFMQDYGVDQITVQRLIAVKSFKGLAKAVIFNSFTDVIINALLLFIGIGLFAYYSQTHTTPPANSDAMLPYYVITVLPNGISGLIITAIFAAAMSSMDSGINSLSTVIINDFVKPLSKKQASDTYYVK
jgi:Na+/proline symporter